jgi:hypothetical protein
MQSSLQFYHLPMLQLADSQILVGAESLEALAWAMSQWNVHKRIMMIQGAAPQGTQCLFATL